MKQKTILSIFVLLVGLVIIILLAKPQSSDAPRTEPVDDVSVDTDSGEFVDDSIPDDATEPSGQDSPTMDDSLIPGFDTEMIDGFLESIEHGVGLVPDPLSDIGGSYTEYHEALLAYADQGKVVLFFHAPWCPSCRSYDKKITNDPNLIPDDVVVLKTDYDTETELKKKYGVTYQHTFVQVDSEGNMITKWSGDRDLYEL